MSEDYDHLRTYTEDGERRRKNIRDPEFESVSADDLSIGPNQNLKTVSPDDDWHEKVGDEDDPLENTYLLVLPGQHDTKRQTLISPTGNVTIVGVGNATIKKPAAERSDLTSNASSGATTVAVADGSKFEVGRGVIVCDDTTDTLDSSHAYITDVSGNSISLSQPLRNNYSTSNNAECAMTHSPITTGTFGNGPLNPPDAGIPNVHIRGLRLEGAGETTDGPQDYTTSLIHVEQLVGGSVRDNICVDDHADGISFQNARSGEVKNNVVRRVGMHGVHTGYTSDGTRIVGNLCENLNGTGIYISYNNSQLTIERNDIIDCGGNVPILNNGTDAGGIGNFDAKNSHNNIRDNYIDLSSNECMAFKVDGGVQNTFENNEVYVRNNGSAIENSDGSVGTEFENNYIEFTNSAVTNEPLFELWTGDVRISNNTLIAGSNASNPIRGAGVDGVKVIENEIDLGRSIGVIQPNVNTGVVSDWRIEDNEIINAGSLLYSGGGELVDFEISGNSNITELNSAATHTRLVRNGWSTNPGDPSSTGAWNGNGFEGIQVRDTANGNNYVYVNDGWVAL